MPLPRISRRRRRWLNDHLPAGMKAWVEARDPFYLLAESDAVVARSAEVVRARPGLMAAPDRVFCDLGFNTRQVFNGFYSRLGPEFRWFGFEIQRSLWDTAQSERADYTSGPVEFLHAAATTFDGSIAIAVEGKASGDGSTILPGLVRDPSTAGHAEVRAIDLGAFLMEATNPASRIVLKMDIEGAEYDLLQHLSAHPVFERLDLILCEFHWRRFPGLERYRKLRETLRLIRTFGDRGVLLLSWR